MLKKMAVWIIGVGFATLVIGILLLGYLSPKGIRPIHLVAIAAIFTGVAVLFKEISSSETNQSIKDTGERNEKKLNDLETQNRELLALNDSLKSEQGELLATVDKFRRENNELSSKLSSQVLKHYNFTTGGDDIAENYPYVIFMEMMNSQISVSLSTNSKYPLYDVHVSIADFPPQPPEEELRKRITEHRLDDIKVRTYNYPVIPVLAPNRSVSLGNFIASNTETHRFSVNIMATNGSWRQSWVAERNTKSYLPSRGHIVSQIFINNDNEVVAELNNENGDLGFHLKKRAKKNNPN